MSTTYRQAARCALSLSPAAEDWDDVTDSPAPASWLLRGLAGVAIVVALFAVSRQNYVLFHCLIELFCIAVAWSVFLLVWNSRSYMGSDAFASLAIGYLFVGAIDLVHTLAYKGMGVLQAGQTADLATQLWICGRGMESWSLLAFPILLVRRVPLKAIFSGYVVVTVLLLGAALGGWFFPECYVEGEGLTAFKRVSEYVICLTLVLAAVLLYRHRTELARSVFVPLFAAILVSIVTELVFTLYVSVYDAVNFLGHCLKFVSYYLVYVALIQMGLTKPHALLFRKLTQKEAAIASSEQRWRSLAESSPDFILTLDSSFQITYANGASPGKTAQQLLGTSILDHLPPEERRGVRAKLQSVVATHQPARYDTTYYSSASGVIYYESLVVPHIHDGRLAELLMVSRDVTQRRRREELLAVRFRLKDLASSCTIDQLVQEFLREARRLTFSQNCWYQLLDDDPAAPGLQNWSRYSLCGSDDISKERVAVGTLEQGVESECLCQRRPVVHNELEDAESRPRASLERSRLARELAAPVVRRGNVVAILYVEGKQSEYDQEDVVAINCLSESAWDLIEHKRDEARLSDNQRFMRSILDSMSDHIVVLDRSGTIVDVNQAWEQFGAGNGADPPSGSWLGVDYLDSCRFASLKSDDAADKCLKQLPSVLDGTSPGFGLIYPCHSPDKQRWFYMQTRPLCHSAGGAVVVHTDVTEQTLAESKLRLAERLRSEAEQLAERGRLAVRLAHEINNPLAGIKNSYRLIRDAVSKDHPDYDLVSLIDSEIDRIASIVRQLYSFCSPKDDASRKIVLSKSIGETKIMLEPLCRRYGVAIESVRTDPELTIHFSDGSLRQILYNLVANAIEASLAGTVVEIDAQADPCGGVVIECRDRGCGIPADVMAQVFEPYFTTKEDLTSGIGLGLGLSIVQSIVKANGGDIIVDSKAGVGTVIRVVLPCSRNSKD